MDTFSWYKEGETQVLTESKGAAIETIRQVEQQLGITFPEDYVQFMQYSNGGCIIPGDSSEISLDPIEDLLNDREIEVELYEGCVFFGSDGGLESYGFDVRATPVSIVEVDRVAGMESAIPAGNSLHELVHYVRHKFDDFVEDPAETLTF